MCCSLRLQLEEVVALILLGVVGRRNNMYEQEERDWKTKTHWLYLTKAGHGQSSGRERVYIFFILFLYFSITINIKTFQLFLLFISQQ
jgi:hypothetical protein